jgi:hypothetical protein
VNEALDHMVDYHSSPTPTKLLTTQLNTLLDIIFVKFHNKDKVLDPELLPSILGIHPFLNRDITVNLSNCCFIVSIKHVLIMPVFILTINKCQGLILCGVILGPLLHPSRKTPKKNGILYIALSCSKCLANLHLLEPLSTMSYVSTNLERLTLPKTFAFKFLTTHPKFSGFF